MSLTLLSYIKQRFLASGDMGDIFVWPIFYLDSPIVEMGTLHPDCICSVIKVVSLRFTALQSPLSRESGVTVLPWTAHWLYIREAIMLYLFWASLGGHTHIHTRIHKDDFVNLYH